MKKTPFKLTGEKITILGIEFEIAKCYDSESEINEPKKIFFLRRV